MIRTKSNLKRIFIKETKPKTAIYFLYLKNEIVYIGQSKNVEERVQSHKKRFIFDSYSFIECDESELAKLEAELIFKYAPKHNKTISALSKLPAIYPLGYVSKEIQETIGNAQFEITAKIIGRILYADISKTNIQIFKNLDCK